MLTAFRATLRRRRRVVRLLLALVGAVACLYLFTPLDTPSVAFLPQFSQHGAVAEPLGQHPIDHFIARGKRGWARKVQRQSKTLRQAEVEYRRRYEMDPPPHFSHFVAFAQDLGHVLIDEYDTLTHALRPFHALPPSILRQRTLNLASFQTFSRVTLHSNGTLSRQTVLDDKASEGVRGQGWMDLLESLKDLPGVLGDEDLVFAINERAEPRAVLSWEEAQEAERILTLDQPPPHSLLYADANGDLSQTWRTWINTSDWGWSAFTASCHPDSPARKEGPWPKVPVPLCAPLKVGQEDFEAALRADDPLSSYPPFGAPYGSPTLPEGPLFSFAESEHGVDPNGFCQHPERRFDQGHFFSDFRNVAGLYPAFSPGVMPGYADIPIPSNYHTSDLRSLRVKINQQVRENDIGGFEAVNRHPAMEAFGTELDVKDGSWDARRNDLYWRGGATGGGSTPAGYSMNFQRHRLVRRFGAERDTTPEAVVVSTQYNISDSPLEVYQMPRNEFNRRALNIGFTSTVGCGIPRCCEMLVDEENDMRFVAKDPWAAVKRFKMIIDVDGMGFSARFFALFNSGAAVVKSTLYREYASDWLQPWVHFIPVSLEFSELPSIWSFFLGASLATSPLPAGASQPDKLQARKLASVGDRRLREIAEAGEAWRREIDRPDVDWAVYAYRLVLEWRRLYTRSDEDFYAGR